MDFSSNQVNEIFFVDGAEQSLSDNHVDAFTSAAAHYLEVFKIDHEVDVYVSQRSILHKFDSASRAWHRPPVYEKDNSVICVYVDPDEKLESMLESLAHEMIHAWQVDRGDLLGRNWKGQDMSDLPYNLQPWEIEAHGNQEFIAACFFNDKIPAKSKLKEITDSTDTFFNELTKQGVARYNKKKLVKIAKVAGMIGLGAFLGI
jgi:hypothetical protein